MSDPNHQPAKRAVVRRVKLRRVFAEVIATLPGNGVRCLLYRLIGYRIVASRIGWRTMIAVESFTAENARLGRRNKIIGPLRMTMAHGSTLGSGNLIWCDFWTLDGPAGHYKRTLRFGPGSIVTQDHALDVAGQITIGAGAHVAGIGTQFWTHGYVIGRRDIEIGADSYVGSRCLFTPGSGVGDRSMVGSGSIVTRRHKGVFEVLTGNPAAVTAQNYYWRKGKMLAPGEVPPLPAKAMMGDA